MLKTQKTIDYSPNIETFKKDETLQSHSKDELPTKTEALFEKDGSRACIIS
jgi:hypothetical protein